MTGALVCLLAWSAGVTVAVVLARGSPGLGMLALAGSALGAAVALLVRPVVVGLALIAGLLGVAGPRLRAALARRRRGLTASPARRQWS